MRLTPKPALLRATTLWRVKTSFVQSWEKIRYMEHFKHCFLFLQRVAGPDSVSACGALPAWHR